ncbi:MAG: hypothetical protein HOO96_39585 [Polyangiaceae bacterium]|nr:hypothetical protein [Polyangiaceae bacterium]
MKRAASVAIAIVGLWACGGGGGGPPATAVNAKSVRADGMALVMACTPTGPERCFDAVDDNCNGLIDEGCGVPTGVLQFVVAWGDSPADVDLALMDPTGTRIHEGARSRNGFRLDKDCPKEGCFGQNVESVVFDGNDPPKGLYIVEVKLGELAGAPLPVRVRLGARVGTRSFGAELELTTADDKKTLMFEL